jgi:hypothetical protein
MTKREQLAVFVDLVIEIFCVGFCTSHGQIEGKTRGCDIKSNPRRPARVRVCWSIAVAEAFVALMLGAMHAAEDGVTMLHAMTDDAAAAMRADRREGGDGAFEAVEDERAAAHGDLEALVVVIAALRAFAHGDAPGFTVSN